MLGLAGPLEMAPMPDEAWPLLTELIVDAPHLQRSVVAQGFWPNELPSLASVELNHLCQQKFTTRQNSITTLVLHSLRSMLYEFHQILQCLPSLGRLEVHNDRGGRPPPGHGSWEGLGDRFPLRSLHTLHILDSHGLGLRLFTAPALRHFHYRVNHPMEDNRGCESVYELQEPHQFLVVSGVQRRLETLTVRIHPTLTVNDLAIQTMVHGLVALRYLSLDIRQRNGYHGLRRFQPGVPLNVGALRTAIFQVYRGAAAREVVDFAASHPWVTAIEVRWIVGDTKPYRLCRADREGVAEELGRAAARGQNWVHVGAGHARLSR